MKTTRLSVMGNGWSPEQKLDLVVRIDRLSPENPHTISPKNPKSIDRNELYPTITELDEHIIDRLIDQIVRECSGIKQIAKEPTVILVIDKKEVKKYLKTLYMDLDWP